MAAALPRTEPSAEAPVTTRAAGIGVGRGGAVGLRDEAVDA